MNRQELFDQVAGHLLNQAARSVDQAGNCMYRGPNDRKCAIGILIPDELYHPNMEGRGIQMLWQLNPKLRSLPAFDREHLSFLRELQTIHDATVEQVPALYRDQISSRLRDLANRMRLNTAVLDA